jgi:hypothetical protein
VCGEQRQVTNRRDQNILQKTLFVGRQVCKPTTHVVEMADRKTARKTAERLGRRVNVNCREECDVEETVEGV